MNANTILVLAVVLVGGFVAYQVVQQQGQARSSPTKGTGLQFGLGFTNLG